MVTVPSNGRHLVAYVRTSRLTDWKRRALQHSQDAGHPVFLYRSDHEVFGRHARPGAVLWIIESHPGRGPSLAARLDIAGRIHGVIRIEVLEQSGEIGGALELLPSFEYGRGKRWYAVGDPETSRFFGFNDISHALLATSFEARVPWAPNETAWKPAYGRTFISPRLVAPGGESQLAAAARRLAERSVFVSWKHGDFGDGLDGRIPALAGALAAAGLDCWWDQRALPSSPALERLRGKPDLLGALLDDGLRRARCVLAVGSTNYGEPSASDPSRNWTRNEWFRAHARLTWAGWGRPTNGWPDARHHALPDEASIEAVADEVAKRVDTMAAAPP